MPFGNDLEQLTTLIKEKEDKELEQAFETFLEKLSVTLKNYVSLLNVLSMFSPINQSSWDVTFEQA